MKKFYQIITLCAITFAIVSCGGSTTSSETYYKNACNKGDIEKAHAILSEFREKYMESMTIDYGNIFVKEA